MRDSGAAPLFPSAERLHEWVDWLKEPAVYLGLSVGLGLVGLVGLLVLPFLLARLDADYFVRPKPAPTHWLAPFARNGLGVLLLLCGIAMLVLPGQGLLTILLALILLDFPGKRGFERWLVNRPSVLRSLNVLRVRLRRPPFRISEHRGE